MQGIDHREVWDGMRSVKASDGVAWRSPTQITSSVNPANTAWQSVGPGGGIQLAGQTHNGRLVVPCTLNWKIGVPFDSPGAWLGYAAYSTTISHMAIWCRIPSMPTRF